MGDILNEEVMPNELTTIMFEYYIAHGYNGYLAKKIAVLRIKK
jgi:hypothetical protein